MTPEQIAELKTQFGNEAASEIKKQVDAAEIRINDAADNKVKGFMTAAAFDSFKSEELKTISDQLEKLDTAAKEQGNKINAVLEKSAPNSKSFEQFLIEQAPEIKKCRTEGKMMEITGAQLKAAGITSIGGSIQDMTSPPGSPYAPGISNDILNIFDIMRNPNYIVNQVDLGRADSSRLAWANETDYQGAPEEITEGETKPLTQHKFQVELSNVKKIAGYITLTEEFDQDLPTFSTTVRRMLQNDVLRGWDDAIQTAVIAAAQPFSLTQLDGQIQDANLWSSLRAMWAQVVSENFLPNSIGINPITGAMLDESKNVNGTYLLPPYLQKFMDMKTEANKVAFGRAFVGDLKQFKVDIYKDFVLKIGLVNDDLIKNQFSVVGEIRYHRYISDARKKAIVYDNLASIRSQIDGTPHSIA